MSGFITLQRQLLDWEWYKDINTKSLFIHCLLKANWEDKSWQGKEIKRGQFITSTNNLSKELNLSIKEVRTAISKLEKTNEIIKKGANKYTLLTVVKYDIYQNINIDGANKGQTKGKQRATTNNINNNNILTTNENSINTRKLKFAHTLEIYINEFGKDMIREFYNYWSEPNKSNTKFKQELQKTWDTKMRLTKWKNNNFNNNNNSKIIQDEQLTEIARLARSGNMG